MGSIIFIDNAGFKYTPSPHKIARGGPQPPHKKYQARDRPTSENLIQARASPRGAGQPMQGFNTYNKKLFPKLINYFLKHLILTAIYPHTDTDNSLQTTVVDRWVRRVEVLNKTGHNFY